MRVSKAKAGRPKKEGADKDEGAKWDNGLVLGALPIRDVKHMLLRVEEAKRRINELLTESSHRPEIAKGVSVLKVFTDPSVSAKERKSSLVKAYEAHGIRHTARNVDQAADEDLDSLLINRMDLDLISAKLAIRGIKNPARNLTELDAGILQLGGAPLLLFALLVGKREIPGGFRMEWCENCKRAMRGELETEEIRKTEDAIDLYFEKWLRPWGVSLNRGALQKLIDTGFGKLPDLSFKENPKLEDVLSRIAKRKYSPSNEDVSALAAIDRGSLNSISPTAHWLLVSAVLAPPSPLIGINDFNDAEAFNGILKERPSFISDARDRFLTEAGEPSRIALSLLSIECADDWFADRSSFELGMLTHAAPARLRNLARRMRSLGIIPERLLASVLSYTLPPRVPETEMKDLHFKEDKASELETRTLDTAFVEKIMDTSNDIIMSNPMHRRRSLMVLSRYARLALGFSLWKISVDPNSNERMKVAALDWLSGMMKAK